jgi:2-phospho-L-lactate guanylyltransferase
VRSAVVVPVKAFAAAKLRLAEVLAPTQRVAIARAMAAHVIGAAGPLPVAVVCDDDEVAAFAVELGAEVLWTPGLGLNGAVTEGVARLAAVGVDEVVVAHADLPFAAGLRALAGTTGTATIVGDRHGDGTNVLAVPATIGFAFAYGPRSFTRHRAEAARLGLAERVVHDAGLAWDVDVPTDLHPPTELGPLPWAVQPCP